MTKVQYQRELEKLEREADKRGCCILPAKPLFDPDDRPAPTGPRRGDPRTTELAEGPADGR